MHNVKSWFNKEKLSEWFSSILPSLVSILFGLLLGFVIMIFTNPSQSIGGFFHIFVGGFNRGLDELLYQATPIILTGLSVGFAFRTGLFNIGASGQFMVGAVTAIIVGNHMNFLPGFTHMFVAIILAALAGAIWGSIPGLLKAYQNVNEVVSSIMMNYIGMYVSLFFVKKYAWDFTNYKSQYVNTNAVIPKWSLFGTDIKFYSGILIALIAVVVIYVILNKTTFGYELQAVGFNRDASKYAGINEKKSIVYSMIIAGLISGIAGATYYLVAKGGPQFEPVEQIATQGFDGISVALIGLSNPIGIFFSGIFLAYIRIGGWGLQLYGFYKEIVDVIIGIIIYSSALTVLMRRIIKRLVTKREQLTIKRGVEHE